jgi:hypothetical protein
MDATDADLGRLSRDIASEFAGSFEELGLRTTRCGDLGRPRDHAWGGSRRDVRAGLSFALAKCAGGIRQGLEGEFEVRNEVARMWVEVRLTWPTTEEAGLASLLLPRDMNLLCTGVGLSLAFFARTIALDGRPLRPRTSHR